MVSPHGGRTCDFLFISLRVVFFQADKAGSQNMLRFSGDWILMRMLVHLHQGRQRRVSVLTPRIVWKGVSRRKTLNKSVNVFLCFFFAL